MSTTKVTGMMQTSTKGGDISSASPTVIDTDGDYFDVTGTTNFAAFTVVAGRRFTVQFDGVLTMTHHATTLDLPGAANITTAAGDVAEFFATGTNTVQCVNYTRASGAAVALADNSITLAKMAGGTDGQIITYDASGDPVAVGPGSDGEVLTSTGAGSPPAFEAAGGGLTTVSTVATTSGASVDFTSIPAGTVAIDVIFSLCSLSIGGNIVIQLGDAGGVETTGYLNSSVIHSPGHNASEDSTYWIQLSHSNIAGASSSHPGIVYLRLVNPATYTWIATGQILNLLSGALNNYAIETTTAFKSLSAELTTIRLTNTNTGAGCVFDAGEATIQYH